MLIKFLTKYNLISLNTMVFTVNFPHTATSQFPCFSVGFQLRGKVPPLDSKRMKRKNIYRTPVDSISIPQWKNNYRAETAQCMYKSQNERQKQQKNWDRDRQTHCLYRQNHICFQRFGRREAEEWSVQREMSRNGGDGWNWKKCQGMGVMDETVLMDSRPIYTHGIADQFIHMALPCELWCTNPTI